MAPTLSPKTSTDRAALIHREVVQLVALVSIAIAAFFVTRAVAMSNRDLSERNAAEWYRRGERFLDEGHHDEAIAAFRRATVRSRSNRTYLQALARALARSGDIDSARSILLTVRESAPEDARVNLDLARLSAARQDVAGALRFFHDALYAPWPADQGEERRAVRIELIRFLLANHEAGRAQSELIAAAADMPDDVAHHVELAGLFAQAGDDRNALAHFQRALRLAPGNPAALLGAGQAAFDIGQYALARRYLHDVPDDVEAARDVRQVADLVVSRDPVAGRLGAAERRRRLDADLSYVEQRLAGCMSQRPGQSLPAGDRALQDELLGFERGLRRSVTLDQDTIESGLDLVERLERDVIASCGSPTPVDRALLLIARGHGAASQ